MCKRLRMIALTAGLTFVLCFGGCSKEANPANATVESVESTEETETKKEADKLSDYLEGLADVYIEVGSSKVDYLNGLTFDKKKIASVEVDDSRVDTKQAGVYTLRYILSGKRVNGEVPKETVKAKVFVVKKDEAQKLADSGVAVETDKGTKKNSKGEEVTRVVANQNASNAVSGGNSSNTSKPSSGGSGSGTTKPSTGNTGTSSKPSGGNSGTSSKPSGGNNGGTTSKPSESKPSTPSKPSETKPSNPAETKPSKPAETTPSKPAETKPSKPAETTPSKPAETEPPQTKPVETEPLQTNPPETEPPQTEPRGEWVHHKDPIYETKCYSICNGCGADITGFEEDHAYEGYLAGTSCFGGFWSKYEQVITGYNEWDEWVEY